MCPKAKDTCVQPRGVFLLRMRGVRLSRPLYPLLPHTRTAFTLSTCLVNALVCPGHGLVFGFLKLAKTWLSLPALSLLGPTRSEGERAGLVEHIPGPFFGPPPWPPAPETSTMSQRDAWQAPWVVCSAASRSICGRRVVSKNSCSSSLFLPPLPCVFWRAPSHTSLALFPVPFSTSVDKHLPTHIHSGDVVTRSKCSAWSLRGKKGKGKGCRLSSIFPRPLFSSYLCISPLAHTFDVSMYIAMLGVRCARRDL